MFDYSELRIQACIISRIKCRILGTRPTYSPVEHVGQIIFLHVRQVTGKHVGQVTREHYGQVTGEPVGPVTGQHVGKVTVEPTA